MTGTPRLLMFLAAFMGGQASLLGCTTQTSEEPVSETTQTLSACGIGDLSLQAKPERVEGDSNKCFVAIDTGKRAKLAKDPNDLGLAEPRMISNVSGIRVYEGKGTSPGTSLFAASTEIAGYTCSVNGFTSAADALKGVEVCALVKGGAR